LLVIPILFLSKNQEPSSEEGVFKKIFLVYAAACFITVLVVGLVWGSHTLKARWLHPLLLIAPFAILYWASKRHLPKDFLKFYLFLVLALGSLVLAARVWQLGLSSYFGNGSRATIPIKECVSFIPKNTLEAFSEVCASDNFLAAHLKVRAPALVVRAENNCDQEFQFKRFFLGKWNESTIDK